MRRLIFICVSALTICSALIWSGCRGERREQRPASASDPGSAALIDSPQNRREQAKRCVAAYPLSEFSDDLSEQAAAIVGQEVAAEARARLKQRLSAEEFEETRIEMLVRTLSAREIARLGELYRSPEDRTLIKKLHLYDEEWRKYLAPVVLEALSNTPQK
jgi:hypothetical protein